MNRKVKALFVSSLLCVSSGLSAEGAGLVNFNLGASPGTESVAQAVTLYGCNTVKRSGLFWNSDNQIVGNIPYGWQTSASGKRYFVDKYYIASPPVFQTTGSNSTEKKFSSKTPSSRKASATQKPPFIGLVTPHKFTFKGKAPAQIVYFDYRILEPTPIDFIPVDYNHKKEKSSEYGKTCAELGVDIIPVNIHCSDFPWRNGALGASGIGDIKRSTPQLFLPLAGSKETPLQCDVSILDDIILDYDISFENKQGVKRKKIDLDDYYNKKKPKPIPLLCKKRPKKDIPTGCQAPH